MTKSYLFAFVGGVLSAFIADRLGLKGLRYWAFILVYGIYMTCLYYLLPED